jgi:hypothetical protein
MTTWATTNKNSASWGTTSKSGDVTYLVSEALDYYLVGSAEDEYLITQSQTDWATTNKS